MQILITSIIFFAAFQMIAQQTATQSSQTSPVVITAKGTGETTGHIMDVTLQNPHDQPLRVNLGPLFIPSDGKHQSYVVPDETTVSVPAQGQLTIPIKGYCADIHSPPVPSGKPMVSNDVWIEPEAIANNWQPSISNGWEQADGSIVTIPGKSIPLGHVIDINKHPDEAAPLLLDAIIRISEAYDNLQSGGNISTPFSGNPEKERESVIQQTFWIYTSALTGAGYSVENFASKTAEQYEKNSGKMLTTLTEEEKDQLAGGIADFWNTFEAVGAEAKIILTEGPGAEQFGVWTDIKDWLFAPDYDKVKKADDFDKIRRTKYDKYVVEREINKKSHEDACEAIDIESDSAFAKACKRVYGK